jgi:hypothetical protein
MVVFTLFREEQPEAIAAAPVEAYDAAGSRVL